MSKIMIVEDHPESRYLLERLLLSRGHQVTAAENGHQGLQMARQDPPDVIISDIMMPVMNGFKLCCRIKKDPILRQIPFIFYTATFTDENDRKLAMSLGASRFLVKPTDGDRFLEILDSVLKEHRKGILHVPEGTLTDHESLIEMYENSITRKLAETVEKLQEERRALIQSERRLKEAQELAHIGHWELDLKTGVLEWSDEIYRILGIKPQAFDPSYKAIMDMEIIHPEDRAFVSKAHKETLSKKTASDIEYRLRLKDGTIKYVNERFQTLYDDEGMPTCSMGTVQDITERRQAETELRKSEERYRVLVEHAGEIILVVQDGKFKFVNRKVTDLLGFLPDELMEKPFSEYIHPDDKSLVSERHVKRLAGEDFPGIYPFRVIQKTGHTRWVELTVAPIEWEGRPATLNFLSDITDRKRAEEERDKLQAQLLQAQKLEAVGRLAGGVAHDFNNLLTVILGYSEMAQKDLLPQHPHHSVFKEICDAGNRARNLTRQLLAFSRKQVLDMQLVDVNAVVGGFEKLMRRIIGEDVVLKMTLHTDPLLVKADASQLEQVLMNLAVNARDAMPTGGILAIETRMLGLAEGYASQRSEMVGRDYAMIVVSDTGVGMESETLGQIFEPFFTTKGTDRGTGLGLATSYGIVKQHGGDIHVYSEPGQGATFKIYLPLERGEEATKEPLIFEKPRHINARETVLAVEDDASVLRLTVEILRSSGYNVLEAGTADRAMELARSHGKPIDLLLTDVVLPKMNGPEMAAQIRKIHPGIRVLYTSGHTEEMMAHHGILKKGIMFLQKPFTARAIREKVAEALGSKE